MIKITRTAQPSVLVKNAENWKQQYLAAKVNYEAFKTPQNKKIVATIEKKYNHIEVKDSLKIMFKKKCAFCESHITHIDYGQIEHFKPKSRYPELCFEWSNFLLSCPICNGAANKGDKFPLANEGGPLINPVAENPNYFFKFEYDTAMKSFLLLPKTKRAATTIKTMGLNRDDLAENRTILLAKIVFILENIIDRNLPREILNEFSNLFSEKDEYYAFIKILIKKVKLRL